MKVNRLALLYTVLLVFAIMSVLRAQTGSVVNVYVQGTTDTQSGEEIAIAINQQLPSNWESGGLCTTSGCNPCVYMLGTWTGSGYAQPYNPSTGNNEFSCGITGTFTYTQVSVSSPAGVEWNIEVQQPDGNVYTCSVDSTTICPTSCTGPGIVVPTWYCGQINQALVNNWMVWGPIVMIVIFLAFCLSGIIFMVGIVLRNEKVRNFAVGELYEAMATTLIAGFFLFDAAVLFGIIPQAFTGPVNPYITSLGYIAATLSPTQTTLTNLYNIMILAEFQSSISITIGGLGFTTNLAGQVLSTAASLFLVYFVLPARILAYIFVDGLLALYTQFYLILFFMYIAIPVFLIPGVVFRAFFPLRNLGGLMIAVAMAFYLILPLLFSVAYFFVNTGVVAQLSSYAQDLGVNGCSTQTGSLVCQTNTFINGGSPTAPLVQDITGLESAMGGFWLSIAFYPALIAAITYQFIKIIADFIGGATRTTSKFRLI